MISDGFAGKSFSVCEWLILLLAKGTALAFCSLKMTKYQQVLCSYLLGLTSSSREVQSCPEWDFDCNLTADSNTVKQPGPKTEVCMFWKSVS